MRILHINSGFAGRGVHSLLVNKIDDLNIGEQFVYVPVRTAAEIGSNQNLVLENTRYQYSHILKPYHRAMFRRKIDVIYSDLTVATDASQFNMVHAHFLFSDGAVALRLKEEKNIPYIVAVRNTDINYFIKYRPDLRSIGWKILDQASAVVFISPAYKHLLLSLVPAGLKPVLDKKALVIPNGIADFWFENASAAKTTYSGALSLLYVGELSRNKNVRKLMRASAIIKRNRNVTLTIVGGGGNDEAAIKSMAASKAYDHVTLIPRVKQQKELLAIYRNHDIFAMPSIRETFGLVYIEALSQGLPVVHSKGQGVDGYFTDDRLAVGCDPQSPEDIAEKINHLSNCLDLAPSVYASALAPFHWDVIAQKYLDAYSTASH